MVPCLHPVMSMQRAALLVVGLALTACTPALPSDDQHDAAGGDDDAPVSGASLKLELQLDKALPAQINVDLRLDSVYLSATSVRAIADAGDASLTNCEMKWDGDDKPDPFTFTNPPVGTYSTIDLRIAKRETGTDPKAFQVKGKFRGTDFRIEGTDGVVTASPAVQLMLKAGMRETVKIEIGLDTLLEQIDWSTVPKKDGDYNLDDTDPQMPNVHYQLALAFRSL